MAHDGEAKQEGQLTERQESLAKGLLTTQATLVAWLIFLGFGSTVLARYYSHIHYFPELKWEESFSYLAAVTVIGGGIVAIYALLLYIPGWIWSEFLIFDSELRGHLCYLGPDGRKHEPCFQNIVKHLVLPFALLMVALHFAIFANSVPLMVTITIAGLTALMWYSRCEFLCELALKSLETQAETSWLLVKYTATSGIAALASIASVFILRQIINPNRDSWPLLVICTVAVVISNLLVAVQFRDKPTRAILTGIIAAMTLLIYGETFSDPGRSYSENILKRFGIGDDEREVTLYVTEEGRKLLAENKLTLDDKVTTLKSRLGEEYLVGWYEEAPGGRIEKRVALPKKMVSFWVSGPAPKPEGKPGAKPDVKEDISAGQKIACGLASWLLVILLFALHSLINFINSRLQRRRAADLWKFFGARRTRVVAGTTEGRISLGDAVAFAEIQDFFAERKYPRPELIVADRLTREDLSSNLIVLGGPEVNEVSKHLSECILDPKIFHPVWADPEGELSSEYVLIYRLRNPMNRGAQVLLVAGNPCHGAWVGIRHLTSDSFLYSDAPEKLGSFELILKSEVHCGEPKSQGAQVFIRTLGCDMDSAVNRRIF